jgi:serine/threonine-protein kinase
VIARFDAERQALALMEHPNIARVLDAGATDNGRPYFVMEFVRGIPLTEFCDQRGLTVIERLQLFVTVCQAVQHAHQKGIIHRDIKPSNVLVTLYDGPPVVKVIDFGVAKATQQPLTENSLVTSVAQMVGTPLYMSPEQASGLDVDTRSDVYSLGVMLYELLTGATPFDKERLHRVAYDEVWRIIREEDPPKPSTRISALGAEATTVSVQRKCEPGKLGQLVRGELDWIVMKALEKDRDRRYESASALASDIEHYLRDEPVQACPPSMWYRFRKFSKRNKRTLAAATVLAMSLLVAVGAVAGTLGWVAHDRATRELIAEREATSALAEARQWEDEEKWPAALSAVKRAQGVLAGEPEGELVERAASMRSDIEMVLRLEGIMLDLQNKPSDPIAFDFTKPDLEYAKAFREYGIDVETLGIADAAERVRRRAICLQLAVGLDAWAEARRYALVSKPHLSDPSWQQLLAIASLADPDPSRKRVREALVKRDRQNLEQIAAEMTTTSASHVTFGLVGRALSDLGSHQRAESLLRQAQRRYPTSFWLNFDLAMVLLRQGPDKLDDGIRFLSVALALRPDCPAVYVHLTKALTQRGDSDEVAAIWQQAVAFNADSVWMHFFRAVALAERGKLEDAIAAYREVIRLKPDDAGAHNNLGGVLRLHGQLNEAIVTSRKAIQLNPRIALYHNNLGRALASQNKLDEAVACFNEAIRLKPSYALAYNHLGKARARQGKLTDAVACYRKSIALDPHKAYAHRNLAVALGAQGKQDEAIASYQQAIRLTPSDAELHYRVGLLQSASNRPRDAKESFQRALEVGTDDPTICNALAWFLATSTDATFRDPARSVELAKKAVELAPSNGAFWHTLGVAHYRAGEWNSAIAGLEKSMALRTGGDSFDWFFLAMAQGKLGNVEEAQCWHARAIEWMDKNQPNDEELRRFRLESEESLELIAKPLEATGR